MPHRSSFRHIQFVLALLWGLSTLLLGAAPLTAAGQPALPGSPLSASVAGQPIAAGDYLFWLDRRGAIYGYHQPRQRTFVVARLERAVAATQLASDGYRLAWLERRGSDQRIQTYDLATTHRASISLPARAVIAGLALDGDLLYYADSAVGRRGIVAHRLSDDQRRQVRALPDRVTPGRLVAADGRLAWSEYVFQGRYLPPLAALYLYRPGDSARLAVQGGPWSGSLSGFDLTADHLVWSFALEREVWLLDSATGTRRMLAADGMRPAIRGATAVWERWDAARRQSAIVAARVDGGPPTPVVTADRVFLGAIPLADETTLAVTVDQRPALRKELYVTRLPIRGPYAAGPPASSHAPPPAPSTGQILVEGRRFVVDGAPEADWTFNGVHLILPSRGINGSSFSAEALADPHVAAERQLWLDRAQQIGARSIRIYVDMPGDAHVATPPRPEQLYEWARAELAPRGMRLALVIHNSGRFDDPLGQKMRWLRTLLDCFGGIACRPTAGPRDDQSALLAYINADNEINIHRHPLTDAIPGNAYCRPDDPAAALIVEDCFDHPNPEKRARYIAEAIGWVALVRETVRQHPTGRRVLVTVGMSVDRDKDVLGDGQSAVLNYFTRPAAADPATPTLADLVDFLSPHSYTALPEWELVEPIEQHAPLFGKPVLLEEFGYPTDPLTQPNPERPAEFKETTANLETRPDGSVAIVLNPDGLPPGEDINKLCRYLPKLGTHGERPKRCQPSAPYVVQANLESIFDMRQFAGGVAFMLADSDEKNDGSKACQAEDEQHQLSKNLFLGLFATDDRYHCGGTVNVGAGQIKNTGFRVCVVYRTGNTQLGNYQERVPACEIDLPQALAAPTAQPSAAPAVPPTPVPSAAPAAAPAAPDPPAAPLLWLALLTSLGALLLAWRVWWGRSSA